MVALLKYKGTGSETVQSVGPVGGSSRWGPVGGVQSVRSSRWGPVGGVVSVDACADLCMKNNQCSVFNYYPPAKKCDLFTRAFSSYSVYYPNL